MDDATILGMLEGDANHPGKVDKISGMGLSTNDYTNDEKRKLSGIEEAANNYRLPIASKDVVGGVKTTSTVTQVTANEYTPVPIVGGVPYYKDTTYAPVTQTSPGLMSAADKAKLDGMTAGGTANVDLATTSAPGLVQIGANLAISEGVLSAPVMTGATSSKAGTAGVVPAPGSGKQGRFLRGDGTWQPANNYVLPEASETSLGGVRVGDGLAMQGGKLTAPTMVGATDEADGQAGLVPPAASSQQHYFLRGDGFWVDNWYVLPEAQSDQLGGIKLGRGLRQKDANGAVTIPVFSENGYVGEGLVPSTSHLGWYLRGDGWHKLEPDDFTLIQDETPGTVKVHVIDDSASFPVGYTAVVGGVSGKLYAAEQVVPVAHGVLIPGAAVNDPTWGAASGLMPAADKVKLDGFGDFMTTDDIDTMMAS